jgi:hypothetical protein
MGGLFAFGRGTAVSLKTKEAGMRSPKAVLVLFLSAVMFLVSMTLHAQFENGAVVGVVKDTSGAVVQNATVIITNVDTGVEQIRQTDETGSYSLPSLRSGTYRVAIRKEGFAGATEENVVISVGTTRRVDINLGVEGNQQAVQVTANDLQLQTDTGQHSQIISQQQLEALPLATLEYSDLVGLVAGVTATPNGISTTGGTGLVRVGSFSVNGQRSMLNNFLLDGMDNNAHSTSNQGFSNEIISPNPDALSQFQVLTNNPSAEYGRASGATISVAYKSGTNNFHFELFEYLRNTVFNAPGYFRTSTGEKPTFQRNQFGGNVGGPLWKNKAFFFADYEMMRQMYSQVVFSNVFRASDRALIMDPTAANTVMVTNPYTGVRYQANQPLPESALSPIMLSLLRNEPLPNVAGVSLDVATNNYSQLQRSPYNSERYDLRLDYQWNERTSSFVRLSQSKELATDGQTLPEPYDGGGNGQQKIINQQVALGLTRQVGANQLLEARLGASFTMGSKSTLAIGDPNTYGIKGLPSDPRVVGGIPSMTISGYTTLGRQTTNPQWQYPFLFNPKVSYSLQHDKHYIKAGYEYQQMRESVQDAYPLYGQFTFAGKFSGYLTSDFLFGAPSQLNLTSFFVAHVRQVSHFAFVQDDWHLTDRLTLNLGMRYEYGSPYWDKDNQLSNFDPVTSPVTGQLLRAKSGNTYDRSLVEPDRNDFAPRFGFAYRANGSTVLRGGFGVSYIHYNRDGELSLLAINAPQALFAVISQVPKFAAAGTGTPSASFSTVDDGFPAGMTSPSNYSPATSRIKYVPKNYRSPYVESYSLSIQKEIAKNRILEIGYVGNHSLKLQEVGNYNQRNPALGRANKNTPYTRPISNFGDLPDSFNGPGGNYNSLQATYEQRYVWGLTLLDSFTWSRSFDFSSANAEQAYGNGGGPQDIFNLRADYGPSEYDHPLVNVVSAIYELPVGRGKYFLGHAGSVVNSAIGGWKLSVIDNARSGNTWTPNYSPTAINAVSNITDTNSNGNNNYRPWLIPGHAKLQRAHSSNRLLQAYNSSASVAGNDPSKADLTSTNPYPSNDTPFGNLSRNPLRADPFNQVDMGLNKTFALPIEQAQLQFRAQAYNVLNKTNLLPPGTTCCSTSFGVVTSSYMPRILQFAVKLAY